MITFATNHIPNKTFIVTKGDNTGFLFTWHDTTGAGTYEEWLKRQHSSHSINYGYDPAPATSGMEIFSSSDDLYYRIAQFLGVALP